MSQRLSGYLLGIGSNIDPHKNIGLIIQALAQQFSSLTLSRVLKIPPIGMNSQYDFLNVVVFIETKHSHAEVKTICNAIETNLGRDRNDPSRKTKDRPADLDILLQTHYLNDLKKSANTVTDEYFLYPLLDEISAYLLDKQLSLPQKGIEINIENLTFGQSATTIYGNTGASNKRVIE